MSESATERSRAESEAAQWFARLSRHVTNQDLADFRDWRRTSGNAEAFAHIETTWDKAGGLRADPDIRAATAEVFLRRPPKPKTAAWRRGLLPMSIGMAGVIAALVAASLTLQARHTYTTRVGEQRVVVLEDGSRVHLNTDSRIQVRFRPGERRLVLAQGEALFEAAHDARRPFVVVAGSARVQALGTRFDVRRDAGAVRVTLIEGRVQVRQDGQPAATTLAPRQQLTVTAHGVSPPRAADAAQATGWTTGRLTFHETALQDAVAEINRYASRKIVLDAPGLAQEPVSGVFDTGDTDAFVAALQMRFGLDRVAGEKGEIRMVRAGDRAGG
jgi:transmembrane sensor